MISFPNCKINLGLTVTRKRSDGYHDLETVFYPVQIRDVLEIIACPPEELQTSAITFSMSGLKVAGDHNDNLCVKAYHLLKNDFPDLPPVKMHLHKSIPMGAGLGGGSADGAFTLTLLNEKFSLTLTDEQLISYAFRLGSDCPFFILNTPCIGRGRGEIMEVTSLDLSRYTIVLVNPGIHINTGWAFGRLGRSDYQRAEGGKQLKEILERPIEIWKDFLVNDFEQPVFAAYPSIKAIKDRLYDKGAVYAAMSGSGSTVFGIFETEVLNDFPVGYQFLSVKSPLPPFQRGNISVADIG